MNRFLALAAFAIGGCGCATDTVLREEQPLLPVVTEENFTAVIVPAGYYGWTPSEADILAAEPKIQACIVTKYRELRRTLPRFIRQYWGTTRDDRRVLSVEFFDSRSYALKKLRQAALIRVDARSPKGDDLSVQFDPESQQCSVQRYD